MATKKKGKTAKAPAKKTKDKAAADKAPREKKARVKKEKVPYVPNGDRIVYFMNSLIQAGYVGESIPEESRGKKEASLALRQMAQQLDRQVHRTIT